VDGLSIGPVAGVLIAALCGGAVGLERQRSGHAGPEGTTDVAHGRHFAGLRTFTLLGLFAGVAGWLWQAGMAAPAVALLGGASLFVAAAYVGASRSDVDGTTEVAALVVLAAGFVAGVGYHALASGLIAATVFLLMEKTQLHAWVARVDDAEFRSGVRFAAMAAVVLPLLPAGPLGPEPGLRPRELWIVVLLITGLEFSGYVARKRIGHRRGYTVAGLLGGLISSTSVTLSYARLARQHPADALPLASGAIAANAALFPRVAITALVLNPALGWRIAILFIAPAVVLLVWLVATLHTTHVEGGSRDDGRARNPMNIAPALQLAAVYQIAIYVLYFAQQYFGQAGLVSTGFFLGMTDIDALTISVARQDGLANGVAGDLLPKVVLVGVLGTTLFKLGIATAVGRGAFRTRVGAAFVTLAFVLSLTIMLA
jgi:uncharacterized membrane protein (DUF4010 family)